MSVTYVGSRRKMTVDDWLDLGWEEDEARRIAAAFATEPVSAGSGSSTTQVLKMTEDGIEPLPHVVRHSPTGFEWGYGGSGPADLALSIVCDVLGLQGEGRWAEYLRPIKGGERVVPEPPYQAFKFERIARLDRDEPWSISADEVREFLGVTA
jgi:hypothetical protein